MFKNTACMDRVNTHCARVRAKFGATDTTGWVPMHCDAWEVPRKGREQGLKALITGFALYADAHRTDSDTRLGEDGYFAPHAEDMVLALLAALNFEVGRFDCGTLDGLIRDIAKLAGVDIPE
jgi:hypothetical protein